MAEGREQLVTLFRMRLVGSLMGQDDAALGAGRSTRRLAIRRMQSRTMPESVNRTSRLSQLTPSICPIMVARILHEVRNDRSIWHSAISLDGWHLAIMRDPATA